MRFFCDLHIHSRFSRATSANLTIPELARGAVKKGILVLGTGDLTHPSWLKEIEEGLKEAEPGLYRLKNGPEETRFVLTGEISTIYKQGEKVRKVHHVIGAPDIETAKRIGASLAKVGNILSDGRPILGITSRNLLEIVLEASPEAFLIPAHIWTPWFSALGSKSGFDTIKECYLDLEPHIFAVETGLSSDPLMNWMVKSLDRYHMVSSSDAHSAEKLGREATVFDCGLDYHSILTAMKTGSGLSGTVEFFPEEGKYHLDGHRECGVVVMPEETRKYDGICPKCGKGLTVGVLNRVEELADRPEGERPLSARPYYSLIPLAEMLSEILQVATPTKKVLDLSGRLSERLGGELPLLLETDLDEIASVAGETLALAIRRMRAGEVNKEAGYDGVFGRVRVFGEHEKDMLFTKGLLDAPARKKRAASPKRVNKRSLPADLPATPLVLDEEQMKAVRWMDGPLCVIAGPGTGKTRVMVERIRRLADSGETSVLAVTFTTRAAREIKDRLGMHGPEMAPDRISRQGATSVLPPCDVFTFHSLASRIVHEAGIDFEIADEAMLEKIAGPVIETDVKKWVDDLLLRQSTLRPLASEQAALVTLMKSQGLYTYDGLVDKATQLVSSGRCDRHYRHILVDEFQDINPVQYAFLKVLIRGAASVMVIGDPNQAIYGFRGSSRASFADFLKENSSGVTIRLDATHRLSTQIACAANAFAPDHNLISSRQAWPVKIVRTDSPADFIAREIEALSGGLSSLGVNRSKGEYALSDMAVIVRTTNQAQPVLVALARAGIPCDTAYARPLAGIPGIRDRIELLSGTGWERLVRGVGEKTLGHMHSGRVLAEGLQGRIDQAGALLGGLSGTIVDRLARIEGSQFFRLTDLDALHPFYQYARMYGDDVEGFAEFLMLANDQGALVPEKVHVITAHAAKGLEFGCVFIAGLVKGVFPLAGSSSEEERNLFYVGMTRAKDLLYLVCPHQGASEFAEGIPAEYVEETTYKREKTGPDQMVLFD